MESLHCIAIVSILGVASGVESLHCYAIVSVLGVASGSGQFTLYCHS